MRSNQRLGRWGEDLAAKYLAARGYEIVDRNVRTPYGEIDIVARMDSRMSFVEVKARRTKRFGPPEVAVNPRKLRHMISSAESYAQENDLENWQIDVIAIEGQGADHHLTHFENVGPAAYDEPGRQ